MACPEERAMGEFKKGRNDIENEIREAARAEPAADEQTKETA